MRFCLELKTVAYRDVSNAVLSGTKTVAYRDVSNAVLSGTTNRCLQGCK